MKNKIGLLIILLSLPLLVSGCHIPLINKEITMPFFEKNPKAAIEQALKNLAQAKTISSKADIIIGFDFNALAQLPSEKKEKISQFFDAYGPNRTRVLGIDNYSATTSASNPFNNFLQPGKYKININQLNQFDQTDKNLTRFNTETAFKLILPSESYNLAFAAKGFDNKNYFQIKELPSFAENMLNSFLRSGTSTLNLKDWWYLDKGEIEKINNNSPALIPIPTIKEEEILKVKLEVAKVLRESNLINIDTRFSDEKIGGRNCYHYQASINIENFSIAMKKILEIYKKELKASLPLFDVDENDIDKNVKNISAVIKDLQGELWIGKKDLNLYKISFHHEYDLSKLNPSKSEIKSQPMLFSIDYTQEFSDYDKPLIIQAPSDAQSITILLELTMGNARRKSRDAKRISDIKQIQTALELYYNDNSLYPESTKMLTPDFFSVLPTNPTPNDGICQADFEYQYQVINKGEKYELKYCLGEKTGMIPAGLNTATPEGMFQGDAGFLPYSKFNEVSYADSDKDGLFDYEEKEIYFTDPNKNDTDGDGFTDGQEISGWYDPNGKGKLPDSYSTPEGALITLEKESAFGNYDLYEAKTFYSDEMLKLLKDDFGMSKEEFIKGFVKMMKNEPAVKNITINFFNKKVISENNVMLEYNVKTTTENGSSEYYDDKTFLIKISNKWLIDLGEEFSNLKETDLFTYQFVIDEYKMNLN
jgi:hypothetical protein